MPTTGELIQRYIQYRDYVKAEGAAFEERMKPYNDAMTTIENALLAELNSLDAQNIKTEHGTAFKQKWTQAGMADRNTFMGFIADDFWKRERFLTSAITKKEVEDYIETNGAPPPGVNFNQGIKVNIRRA